MTEEKETVEVDGESLAPRDVESVARYGSSVSVPEEARERVRQSRKRIEEIVETGETVYGVNTGFGELATERIPREKIDELQLNLIRSHSAGAGRELDEEEVRAMMVARLNALVKGYSGVRERVVDLLAEMLNRGVHPVVKSRGSLGASGDLAPLAHMALVMIGEGRADIGNRGQTDANQRLDGGEALREKGLEPLDLAPKEGLALINGTQLTTGLGALVVLDAERAAKAADVAGGLTTEVTMGTTASCDPSITQVRPHEGQRVAARNIKRVTEDSEIVESHRNCDRVQDAYSVRCMPQVHGAVRDALNHLKDAVETELNSATDNPLIFGADEVDERASGTESAAAISGGNFHGEPLALRLDYVKNALTELAAISERRIDRLLNPNIQEDVLQPFLAADKGVGSGYMIAQYTAASLVNESRSLGAPSTDNTPVSGSQEDHVSMSAQSAFNARKTVENALTVIGVELMCGCQASDLLENELGKGTQGAYETIREDIPSLEEDRVLHHEIEIAKKLIKSGVLEQGVNEELETPLE